MIGILSVRERFSFECLSTKTTVTLLVNHKGQTIQWTNQNSKQVHITDAKRGKICACESRLILVLLSHLLTKWREFIYANHVTQLRKTRIVGTRVKTALVLSCFNSGLCNDRYGHAKVNLYLHASNTCFYLFKFPVFAPSDNSGDDFNSTPLTALLQKNK